jgi:hypothetical protein
MIISDCGRLYFNPEVFAISAQKIDCDGFGSHIGMSATPICLNLPHFGDWLHQPKRGRTKK